MQDQVVYAIVLVVYLAAMIGIGFIFFKRNETQSDYLLGGRTLNPFVSAMSAQASDMSGWLMMGLPGAAFALSGSLSDAFWTAVGLGVGTYINWLILAKRLRKFTEVYDNSITIPSYLQNRFHDQSRVLRTVAALVIIVFFLIYTAAQFAAGAKLFNAMFGLDYSVALLLGTFIIVSYTFLGGYKAVCWTDLVQGLLMFAALVVVVIVAVTSIGGPAAVNQTLLAQNLSDHLLSAKDWIGLNTIGGLGILSALAWGFGYFGQPHIVARFMGIRHSRDIKPARRIAMVWVIISLTCAVLIGVVGKAYLSLKMDATAFASMDGEKVFIELVKMIFTGPGFSIIAGVLLAAILAAIMSTADSQLLVTSSAVSEDIFRAFTKKEVSDKTLMWVSRGAVIVITIIAALLAIDPDSSVFGLVAYAWAGFGAAFGPVILLSLYWKRMNLAGAVAGVLSGGITVIVWRNFIKPFFGVYELLPAFIIAVICIVVVSLATKPPKPEIEEEFDRALNADV